MKKQINIKREDLKKYLLSQSETIDSDKEMALDIISSEGYNPVELRNEGLSLISSLLKKTKPEENFKISWSNILGKMSRVGISKNFIDTKIIPVSLHQYLYSGGDLKVTFQAIDYLSAVFGFNSKELIGSEELSISSIPSRLAHFKKPTNANLNQIKAYSHYAQFIARTLSKACHSLPYNDYPSDIDEFKELVIQKHGEISLEALLDVVWGLGICVVPLTDTGVFHGASWNIDGRHVIILKQKTDSHAKWIFDLLHELYHVFAHLYKENTSVIEETELSPIASNSSEEELEANAFANMVIFNSSADLLAQECVARAGNRTERLKQAVIDTAGDTGIRVDFLANYLAFRLQHDGENWWGTANSLQIIDPSPVEITRSFLSKNLDINILNKIESNMLSMAIN